jgi:hypothetical protein
MSGFIKIVHPVGVLYSDCDKMHGVFRIKKILCTYSLSEMLKLNKCYNVANVAKIRKKNYFLKSN